MGRKLLFFIFLIVFASMLGLSFKIQQAKAFGTVYIRANGNVEGTSSIQRNGGIYTLTEDLFFYSVDGIIVERDNMTLDGNGYTLTSLGPYPFVGIDLSNRGNVTIRHITVKDFGSFGIRLSNSFNCTISENSMMNNGYGIYVNQSSNNFFHHNNFLSNTKQVYINNSNNVWDDEVEGNYWSNYTGSDFNNDGIGETPHTLDADNVDHHPLIYPISILNAGTYDSITYVVDISSNSSISNFIIDVDNYPYMISFNVTGDPGTGGLCRIAIPTSLMWCSNPAEWTVRIEGNVTQRTVILGEDYTYIYFTYTHSTKTIQVTSTYAIPEFPSSTAIVLFLITTLLVVFYKRKHFDRE